MNYFFHLLNVSQLSALLYDICHHPSQATSTSHSLYYCLSATPSITQGFAPVWFFLDF